jgi:hypothetical protein
VLNENLHATLADEYLRGAEQGLVFVTSVDGRLRGPRFWWGACSAACQATGRAEIAPEKHRPTSPSDRGLCGVSDASHRATHEEVGHGEP